MRVVWSTAEQAAAIADMPAQGPLAVRTVIVPRERVAHALRRELVRAGSQDVLLGARFVSPVTAAMEVLRVAGVAFQSGEEELRPARLRRLFVDCPPLRYFEPEDLRVQRGWDEALAATIADLEGAGLSPDALEGSAEDGPGNDVATLWRALDEVAGPSWSRGRIFTAAAQRLEADAGAWPFEGPVLAAVTGHEPAAAARLLRAIPGAELALLGARPARELHLGRIAALYGADARAALERAAPPRSVASERELLASHLFEPPEAHADARPVSNGADGTVQLEQHAGVEEELEAAAHWVAREVLEHGTPLEDVAVLLPSLDPLATMVADRLKRLPWPGADGDAGGAEEHEPGAADAADAGVEDTGGDARGASLPVFVAGGTPLSADAAGARVLAVVRALRSYLGADALADVLPALRIGVDDDDQRLSRNDAMQLAWSLGTAGGSAAHPQGALEWVERAERRLGHVSRQLQTAEDDDEQRTDRAHRRFDLERMHQNLEAALPTLRALQALAADVVADAPLRTLWPTLRDFLAEHVRLPGPGARIPKLLDRAVAPLAEASDCGALQGDEALRVVEETLLAAREPRGRFGEPAVYVGTVEGAAGIPFAAVRVLGLCEGTLPSVPHEDPVLPDAMRRELAAHALGVADHRVLAQLHALDRVVRDTSGRVVLSAPKLSVERAQREPSSVFIEAAAAVGRAAGTGSSEDVAAAFIPDIHTVERAYFVPARVEARAHRQRFPLTESAWQDRVAAGAPPPSWWHAPRHVEPARVRAIFAPSDPQPHDGLLGRDVPAALLPGLTPERAASPSRLGKLLRCSYQFLLEDVLGLSKPAEPIDQRQLDALTYGSLLHTVAERFAEEHGDAFGRRERSLDEWIDEGTRLAAQCFEELLERHPLTGDLAREQELRRLQRDFARLLEHDWDEGRARRHVAAEKSFGWDPPFALELEGGALHLRGVIDRLDVQGERTLVRDLKSGKAKAREGKRSDPDPSVDLQIGLYSLAARHHAEDWGVPPSVRASYVYPASPAEPERAFDDDFAELEEATRTWLRMARLLLQARAFVRTPTEDDCSFCDFKPICGPQAQQRALEVLRSDRDDPVLAALRAVKLGEGQEEGS